jgi:ketosteroid isomerase-like protein
MKARIGIALLAALPGAAAAQADPKVLERQVADTERAFARSMAERDLAAFSALLSEQAVFIGAQVLRGKAAVAAGWKAYFEGAQAPFSWEPDAVEVLADGTLAHSTGPVRDASGKPVARFNSVWRQESPGVWRIVFDKGQPLEPAR